MSTAEPDEVLREGERNLRCLLGHDWFYRRREEYRQCTRCHRTEEYSVSETHDDKTAAKGDRRFLIRDGRLRVEQYQVTAWGDDSEHWRWFPISETLANEQQLRQLRREIDDYLDEDGPDDSEPPESSDSTAE